MKKFFYPLKLQDYLLFLGVIILGFGWLLLDQLFFPETWQRIIAFVIVLFGLCLLLIRINNPIRPISYVNTFVVIALSVIICISIVIHVFIRHDFSWKSVLMWFISGITPYLAGITYVKIKKHDKVNNVNSNQKDA